MLLKLLLKNPFRHKLRALLTVLGVAIAILSFGMLRTIVGAWYAGVEFSSATRLVTRNSISIIFPLPLAYYEKIRQVEGVKEVSYANWFGGTYKDKKNFIAAMAVEPRTALDIYPEFVLPPDQEKAFLKDRKSCIAGIKLARRYHWKIGDQITLTGNIFPGDWEFVLKGIYTGKYASTPEDQFRFHWNYLNERLKKTTPRRADQVGFYMIEVKKPELAAQVSAAIDGMFKNSLAETLTETEKAFELSFVSMTEAIVVAIRLVSFVVIIIIMAVAANTMAMTARERIGEYAVLKTLGFGGREIALLVFGESLMLSMTGAAVGMALTYPAADFFKSQLSDYFPVFNVARETLYMDAAAGLIVGVVAGIFPTWRAVRLRIADGLRRIG
ncbi:MAG: ABC transporter permease [Nitrospirota bacterium]